MKKSLNYITIFVYLKKIIYFFLKTIIFSLFMFKCILCNISILRMCFTLYLRCFISNIHSFSFCFIFNVCHLVLSEPYFLFLFVDYIIKFFQFIHNYKVHFVCIFISFFRPNISLNINHSNT